MASQKFPQPNGKYILGYWKIRGLAAPIRMALIHAKIDYVDEMYECTPRTNGEGWSRDCWNKVYQQMEEENIHAFPNLPYLITPTGTVMVQSGTILRHVGRITGLGGRDEEEVCRVDQINDQMADWRGAGVQQFYSPSPNFKGYFEETVPYFLTSLEKWLACGMNSGKGKHLSTFFAGDSITTADYNAFDFITANIQCYNDTVGNGRELFTKDSHPLLSLWMEAVEKVIAEKLPKYLESLGSLDPNNKSASWGGAAKAKGNQ